MGSLQKFFLCLALVVVIPATSHVSQTRELEASPQVSERPNVLVILTDDQEVSSLEYMKNVQRELVDEGVTFEESFATTATCCPSRATFFTGQYAHNHEIFQNFFPRGGARKFQRQGTDRNTLATTLDDAGYRTGYMGKYLNQYDYNYIPPGWDRWWGYMGQYDGDRDELPKSRYKINDNGSPKVFAHKNLHETDYFARTSERFIRNADDEPWFLTIAPNSPHFPSYVAERHRGMFTDVTLPNPASVNEKDVSDKPPYIREMPGFGGRERNEIVGSYRKRLRSIQPTDEMVGNLVETLRETGQLENTYIIYASDNGYQFGEHRIQAGKGGPYEESIRVPLVIRGPGVEDGVTRNQLVANIDWAPTIAGWAGTSMSDPDGVSLQPLLRSDGEVSWRESLLIELLKEEGDARGFSAVRTEDGILVEYQNDFHEYYDLNDDEFQLRNSYGDLDQERRTVLEEELERLKVCSGESCITESGRAGS